MSFVQCRRLVAVLLYCVAIELVIVNGQSTTDDDDINVNEIVEFKARVAKLEGHLAAAIAKIAKLESSLAATDNSKFSIYQLLQTVSCVYVAVCVVFVVFSARRYASAVYAVIMCHRVFVCPSVSYNSEFFHQDG